MTLSVVSVAAGGLALAASFGAELGNVASWASAVASSAAVAFAVLQVRRADKRARVDRLAAQRALISERQHSERLLKKQFRMSEIRWTVDRLTDLLLAWDLFSEAYQPTTPRAEIKKAEARARALVSAVPPHMATLAGQRLRIWRSFPTPPESGPEELMDIPDIHEVLGPLQIHRLEIEWNLQYLNGDTSDGTAKEYIRRIYRERKEGAGGEV